MDKAATKKRLQDLLGLTAEHANIVVVGLGKTGFSVVRFLFDNGFKFSVVDSRSKPPFIAELLQIIPDIPVDTGAFEAVAFLKGTHLVVSPGVSLDEEAIQQALSNGTVILSDIDLFACSVNQPVIAITGSNGKSTVTVLLGEMAIAAGKITAVGGNLGTPALELIKENIELYILELSSFQLERTTALQAVAATVLNVTPDHLDRHHSINEYAQQKQLVFRGTGVMILNADDALVMNMQDKTRKTVTFSIEKNADFHLENIKGVEYIFHGQKQLLPITELALDGRHNIANAMAALALADVVKLPMQIMCATLRSFQGLAHRMQRVAEINGVIWVNDSKATNVGACVAALQGYQHKVILIAGGDAKGADMRGLADVVKNNVKAIILMGKDANFIEQALKDSVPVHRAETIEQAVTIAAMLAKAGESVLLSPACASLDQYKNYQERGDKFSSAVRKLAA